MLLSKRCPHTDVINFFEASEPHMAIGSITKCGTPCGPSTTRAGYAWRVYAADMVRSGHAPDVSSAERDLRALIFDAVIATSARRR